MVCWATLSICTHIVATLFYLADRMYFYITTQAFSCDSWNVPSLLLEYISRTLDKNLFSSFVKESWRSWSTLCLMVKCQYSLLRKYIYSCADSLKVSLTALIYFQRSHWHGPCGESIWKVNLSLEARDGHEKMKRTYCHTNIGFLVKV